MLGVVLVIAAQAQLGELGAYPDLAKYNHLPRPVRVFIDRRAGCNHWGGEEPYDRERAREIAAAARGLRCASLDRDERALKSRYRHDAEVLKALAATRDAIW